MVSPTLRLSNLSPLPLSVRCAVLRLLDMGFTWREISNQESSARPSFGKQLIFKTILPVESSRTVFRGSSYRAEVAHSVAE